MFKNRQDVEAQGLAGVSKYQYDGGGVDMLVTRQLSAYDLCVKPGDPNVAKHHEDEGFWEAWITLWVTRNVRPGSFCIDGGSNYGYYTFLLAKMGCRVVAVEANLDLLPYLFASAKINECVDLVDVWNRAITDKDDETVKIGLLPSSINTTIVERDDLIGHKLVHTVTLDTIAKHYQRPVDFIKLDIEGAEEKAWHGMKNLLAANPTCVILMEFVPEHYALNGKLFFQEILKTHNIAYVDYNGDEKPISYDFIENDTEPFRMLVLRSR